MMRRRHIDSRRSRGAVPRTYTMPPQLPISPTRLRARPGSPFSPLLSPTVPTHLPATRRTIGHLNVFHPRRLQYESDFEAAVQAIEQRILEYDGVDGILGELSSKPWVLEITFACESYHGRSYDTKG
jgi:hypothetical protein